jgi:hypothetical protein
MGKWISAAAACALMCSGAARADWMEAQSPHFVIYADESPGEIQRFSQELEVYHQALAQLTGIHPPDPSPSNRLTIFVVRDILQVQKLFGGKNHFVGGFYFPRAGDSLAVVPHVSDTSDIGGEQDFSMVSLMHEYAHHFLISNGSLPMPRWLGEGSAEFFSSAGFPSSGGIEIGMPAYHRIGELFGGIDVKVSQLLDPKYDADGSRAGIDSFYGKSWLLYHYLNLSGKRPGQLAKYGELLAKGEDSLQAGKDAFGDLDQLDRELHKYLNQRKDMTDLVFSANQLPIGRVTVRELGEGEAEVMPLVIRTRVGVTPEQAKEVLPQAREAAAKYPDDPAVLTELAEAECDAHNFAESVKAADAALARDPRRTRAYYEKGRALFELAAKAPAGEKDAAYQAAVAPLLALNKIEPDNPLPLLYYFRSFVERGAPPPADAVNGLARAAELAPYDLDLRLGLAEYQIGARDYRDARGNLVPIAYAPEGSPMSAAARELIERIDAGKPPTAKEAVAIIRDSQKKADAKGEDSKGGKA